MSYLFLYCCLGKKVETTVRKRWTWGKKAENSVDHRFSDHSVRKDFAEKVAELPSHVHSVKTMRLSENSFEHDFSDCSNPEKSLSYARRVCRLEEEEIVKDGRFVPQQVKQTSNILHIKADVHPIPPHVIFVERKQQKGKNFEENMDENERN